MIKSRGNDAHQSSVSYVNVCTAAGGGSSGDSRESAVSRYKSSNQAFSESRFGGFASLRVALLLPPFDVLYEGARARRAKRTNAARPLMTPPHSPRSIYMYIQGDWRSKISGL